MLLFLKKDIIVARSKKEIGMDNFVAMLKEVGSWAITEGIKVLVGVILLFILFKITNFFTRRFDKLLNRKMIEPTIIRVIVPLTRRVVKFVLVLIFLDYLGIQTASITAAIASAGVAIGLALQGSLSNLAGGIVILVMHPYKIGDYVQCDGYEGTVTDIKLFYTYLKTGDNKVVVMPNGKVSNEHIVNVNQNETRRQDLVFSISYNDDFEKAKQIILDCIKEMDYVLEDPAPFVNITEHASSSINILARFWVPTEKYWDSKWFMLERVKKAFDENKIEIPYPQLDVHSK